MSKWIKKWQVPKSSGDSFWVVSQGELGEWGCSCPRWKFKREQCHHIQAVKTNPMAYDANNPVVLPEIVPGNVEEVTMTKKYCLHPLVPLDGMGSEVLATILFDCLQLGYSWGILKKRFSNLVPRSWTQKAVIAHIENSGRVLIKTESRKFGLPNASYVRVGIPPALQ